MLVAITSDIHNNLTNLKKVLDYCASKKIRKMICCGDLASPETLDFLNDNFPGEIFYCFGNMEQGHLNMETLKHINIKAFEHKNKNVAHYKNTIIYSEFGEIRFGNKRVAFVHYPDKAKELCQTGKYDFVFYGHTHKPWSSFVKTSEDKEENINGCLMLNPGNVANERYLPTFAIWNTGNDKFELVRVNELK
ncbi:YfcE family phosphodiesterase [bacterium]|nr:YfcE family phosphodiesterase [bacterium]